MEKRVISETTLNTSQLEETLKTIASLIDLTHAIKLKAEEDYYCMINQIFIKHTNERDRPLIISPQLLA